MIKLKRGSKDGIMVRQILFLAFMGSVCSHSAVAGTLSTVGTAVIANYDFGGKPSPVWSGGALLAIDRDATFDPIIHVFGRNGGEITTIPVTVPDAVTISVFAVSRGPNGQMAACGAAFDAKGRMSPFVALFPTGGDSEKLIATQSYSPWLITFAPDGTIWTQGNTVGKTAAAADIIWHFDQGGNKIGSAVPQSSFTADSTFALSQMLRDPGNQLAASASGIAWLCPGRQRYVEINLSGSVTTDVSTVGFQRGEQAGVLVFTDDGLVFIDSQMGPPVHLNLYSLDRAKGQLIAATPPQPLFRLLGADGRNVVGMAGRTVVFMTVQP